MKLTAHLDEKQICEAIDQWLADKMPEVLRGNVTLVYTPADRPCELGTISAQVALTMLEKKP
jgi:hypothetical protein